MQRGAQLHGPGDSKARSCPSCCPAKTLKDCLALRLLLLIRLKVLVDDRDGHQNAGARSNSAQEIGHNGQGSDAHPSECSGCRNVAVELLLQRLGIVTVTPEEHLLLFQLLGNIVRRGARHLDPDLGEEGAGGEHEDNVENTVQGVCHSLSDGAWRRHVVDQAADRNHLAAHVHLVPGSQELDQLVGAKVLEEQLGDEVEVGNQSRLEDNGHVGGVEQLDGVRLLLAALALGAHREVHAEALEVDDNHEYDDCGQQVHHIW
mmetsp:Transcript_22696/g.63031  ORF Transcript_22696/g.63031 Transcript_22696/m.63031 type:complete len:261 (-) Transcript_22696:871-1653(-)